MGLILSFSEIYFDVAEIYRQSQLEESGQRLENVNRTHLILASGKIEIQKKFFDCATEQEPSFILVTFASTSEKTTIVTFSHMVSFSNPALLCLN